MVIDTPLIVDIEASGFGQQSYPIEVGLALEDDHRYCALILPAADWTHWDDSAERVHHISRDILRSYGKPLVEVADQLNQLLADHTGQTIETIGSDTERDNFMDPATAKEYGLIDHILDSRGTDAEN